jgi:hypothetical protein
MYDVTGQYWALASPSQYASCNYTGGQFMFNNTLLDASQPCAGIWSGYGQYMYIYNEHLINSSFQNSGCNGNGSSTNVAMTDAQATSQGYTTGTAGNITSNNCANDSTAPCSPTAASNGTVGAGANETSTYCSSLASFTSEYAIGTEAANACKYGTTDACSYNTTTNTMNCPGQTAVQRPASGNWDAGAYQFGDPVPPQPPTNVQATAH